MTPRTVRKLDEGDLDSLVEIRRFAFLDSTDYDNPKKRRRFLDYLRNTWGCFVGDCLVAAGAIHPFTMYREQEPVSVAGLAGVVSCGTNRRRGHVRQLLKELLETARDEGMGWCLEHPFDRHYYAKYGWQTISNGLFFEVPARRFHTDGPVEGVGRIDGDDPDDVALLQGIYEQWAPRYNFSMVRNAAVRPEWQNLLAGNPLYDPGDEQRFAFAIDEVAYCVLAIRRDDERGEVCRIADWAYTEGRGRTQLLRFWGTLNGQIDWFKIQIPIDDPLAWELSPHLVSNPHSLQARIVDVVAALNGALCTAQFDVAVRVRDEFCPWNDARFRMAADGERLRVERTDGEADATVDVRALALLASGTPVSHRRAGLIDGDRKTARALDRLATRTAHLSLSDYF